MQRPPASRFVILGGSFSPVHEGHVTLAARVASLPGVTQVLVIPAARNPLKDGGNLLPPDLRLEMVRVSLAHLPKVVVLDLELRRGPPSYTYDTVEELRASHPGTIFEIALGWDAFRDFGAWHRSEELLKIAGLLVVPRAGLDEPVVPAQSPPQRSVISYLPESWRNRVTEADPGVWRDELERPIVRLLSLRIPEVSATRIWAEHRWDLVPERARVLLLRHLEQRESLPAAAGSDSGRHPG